jgi:hypothetical protein
VVAHPANVIPNPLVATCTDACTNVPVQTGVTGGSSFSRAQ